MTTTDTTETRQTSAHADANQEAVSRILASEPWLVDVAPAGDVVPGMARNMILASGPPTPWAEFVGGQRRAIIGAAVFEGLAADEAEAEAKLDRGEIVVEACHDHGCVGSITGVTSWSMPVVVAEDRANGTRGFCRINEGPSIESLTFGVWSDAVRTQFEFVRDVAAPEFGALLREIGGIELKPMLRRSLILGDDLHSRQVASGMVLRTHLLETIIAADAPISERRRELVRYLREAEYLFLHVMMAASKATADAAAGVPGSGVVTAMCSSCNEWAIRVSGLGDEWIRCPMPDTSSMRGRLFEPWTHADLAFAGGESTITETIGFGGMAAAAAFTLQDHSAGTPEEMVELTRSMYRITVAENPEYPIPFLRFRGIPVGIDVRAVAETGILPGIHLGAIRADGGHAGALLFEPPLESFQAAAKRLDEIEEDTASADGGAVR